MLRMFMFLSIGVALLSAFALYAISHQTRQIADKNRDTVRQISDLEREITILRAERSYLMRPARIETLARQLGMRPMRAEQFVTREEVLRKTERRP